MSTESKRLVDQRLRNRVMEALLGCVEWERELATVGAAEYFEAFFDFVPYEAVAPNSAMTEAEIAAVSRVQALMVEASDATSPEPDEAELTASGWPQRIAPEAAAALVLMRARGRFDEEREEQTPSGPG